MPPAARRDSSFVTPAAPRLVFRSKINEAYPMPTLEDALVRVPADLLAESEAILHPLGLSTSEAVRLFLAQVSLRRGLPFAVTLPPADSDDDLLASAAVRQATLDSFYPDNELVQ
jgi:DNA-damage-inducible protein J